jgi:hypothetical protein
MIRQESFHPPPEVPGYDLISEIFFDDGSNAEAQSIRESDFNGGVEG